MNRLHPSALFRHSQKNGSWACTAKVNGHFVGYDDTGHKYIDKDCAIGENLLAGVSATLTAVIFCTKIL